MKKGAKLGGAAVIISLDILDSKEATHFINPSKLGSTSLSDHIKAIVNGSLFVDFAFEATGNTTVLQTAASIVHPYWGVVVAVGIPPLSSETKLPASTFAIGRTIKGVYFGNSKPISAGKQILEWYSEGKIQIKPLITHRIALKVR
jgi:S-(hydroxymethyl)glutathione dehydrogenase/alcohol dehydrogenase